MVKPSTSQAGGQLGSWREDGPVWYVSEGTGDQKSHCEAGQLESQ